MKRNLVSRITARMLVLLLVGVSPVGPLRAGRALADTPDSGLQAIAMAYRERAGWQHSQRVQAELRAVRQLGPSACVKRQELLVKVGTQRGFDGLESLALAQHDCLAAAKDRPTRDAAIAVTALLARNLRFADAPVANLPQRYARRDTPIERAVETPALRVVLNAIAATDARTAAVTPSTALLETVAVQRALCALPLRPGPDGRPSGASLVRVATCEALGTPGGAGVIDEMCEEDARGASPVDQIGTRNAAAVPSGSDRDTRQDAREMAEKTCGSASLPGHGALGFDPLDPFASDACFGGSRDDQLGTATVVDLFAQCFAAGNDLPGSGGGWDPAADGGENEEPQPDVPENGTEIEPTETSGTAEERQEPEAEPEPEPSGEKTSADVVIDVAKNNWTTIVEIGAIVGEGLGAGATAVVIGTTASIVGTALLVGAMASEVFGTMIETSEATRSEGWCMANCFKPSAEDGGDPEVGKAGSYDPRNPACQQLAELGLLPKAEGFEEGSLPPHAIVLPSPEADASVDDNEGFCGIATGAELDSGTRCGRDKDCGPFAQLGDDCSCRTRFDLRAIVGDASCSSLLRCADDEPAVNVGGQCVCATGGEEDLGGRWGRPGDPDPVWLGSASSGMLLR